MDSSRSIRTVTVAGITGAIGASIIQSLGTAGFQVQALTRMQPDAVPGAPRPINAIEVDYSDEETLCNILRGQDAVVSCLGDTPAAVEAQEALLTACISAGVKRFIPSEFGSDTTNERVRSYPFFAAKVELQQRLEEAFREHDDFSYSLLITGPFLDWGLSTVPFIINIGSRTAEVIDSGDVPFSFTRVTTVGNAVAAVLHRHRETKNRAIFVHNGVTTQSQLITNAEQVLAACANGSDPTAITFTTVDTDSTLAEEAAWQAFRRPEASTLEWTLPFINLSIWAAGEPCHFRRTDNAMLDIPVLQGADLEAVLVVELEKAATVFGVLEPHSSGTRREAENRAEKALEEGKRKLVPSTS